MAEYQAATTEARRGGLMVLPSVDGVTPGLRRLADDFASEGYDVVVPDLLGALTDHASAADPSAIDLIARTRRGLDCLPAIQAAIDALQGPVFALGFSFGGTLAWLAAARCSGLSAASAFYGSHVVSHLDEGLRCPAILHFGREDPIAPEADVQRIREAHPDLPVFVYDAGHGFAEPGRAFDEDAARLSMLRTRQLFMRSAGGRAEIGG